MPNISASSVRGKQILDEKKMFSDETPKQFLRYLMKVNTHSAPFEFNYNVLLDGDEPENSEKLNSVSKQAHAEMFGLLQRLQASNPDIEFQGWRCIDDAGRVLEEGNILTVLVKPAVHGS